MTRRLAPSLAIAALAALAGQAAAQNIMYAFNFDGRLASVNLSTGAATVIGPSGGVQYNAAASDSRGRLFAFSFRSSPPPSISDLYEVNPATGAATLVATLTGVTAGHTVRGMEFDANDRLLVLLDMATADSLGTIDMATGAFSLIGPTGQTDLQGLAFDHHGNLFAVGVITNALYRVNPATGTATRIGGGAISPDDQALEFDAAGTLYSARTALKRIDPGTGVATLIGALGAVADVRGLAFVGDAPCYPDCDTSTGVGVLDIFDFLCFQNRYDAGSAYACDCDTSTGPGVCDIFDFLCFQNAFDAGCP